MIYNSIAMPLFIKMFSNIINFILKLHFSLVKFVCFLNKSVKLCPVKFYLVTLCPVKFCPGPMTNVLFSMINKLALELYKHLYNKEIIFYNIP
jgi:hypothetical protein